jgi:predicted lactoylglutathione lyase
MESGKHHLLDIIFVLSLFCLFAILALFVVVLGANVYKSISVSMTQNYNSRTSMSYLTEKVRQADMADNISAGEVAGADALVLRQDIGGSMYETWIYVSDGELYEVLVGEGTQVNAGSGQAIMELENLTVEEEAANLLLVSVTDTDGYTFSSMVCLKSSA